MFFRPPSVPRDDSDPDFKQKLEEHWYFKGVLLADPAYRKDPDFDARLIDPYTGTGTEAFWRGVLETAGSIRVDKAGGGDLCYPHVELHGAYPFVSAFLAFLKEKLTPHIHLAGQVVALDLDFKGKLDWQTKGGFIKIRGKLAQEIIRLLYVGQTIGMETPRRTADAIVQWSARYQRGM
jgi:hypothetical protein